MRYNVQHLPNWNLEAIGFIGELTTNRSHMIIENHSIFGKEKDDLVNLFKPYLSYKNKLKDEVIPIYGKYSKLKNIFLMEKKLEKEDLDLGITLIQYIEQKYKRPLSKENIDELIEEFILDKTRKLEEDKDIKSKVKSLSELIELLETIDIADGEKMLLISIYKNRYEIIEEMQSFTEEVTPIFKKYFYLIEEQYNNSLEDFKKIKDFKAMIEEIVPMKLIMDIEGNIIFTIFPFGGLYMRYFGDSLWISIGIYILILKKWKEEKGFQGAELVSSLKALGDATRLSIITKIAIRPMYIQELAEELDLTPATISHHINTLLKSGLINIIVEKDTAKKIYYEVNKNKLKDLGSTIASLGDENTRGLDFSGKIAQIPIS